MKNPFRRIARMIVILWAGYTFDLAKSKADRHYARRPTMYYVVTRPFVSNNLIIYDRVRFRTEKHQMWGWAGRLLTLQTMKRGCYYHTPDRMGNNALSVLEIEIRRKYFIRERLSKARLL